jgi:hypothetical protein
LITGGATLNTIDSDTNANNAYAGVYYANSSFSGKPLLAASSAAFTYAAAEGTTATGGSPRISIPIDANGDGTTDSYAFADTLGCNNGSADNGTLALTDPTCTIADGAGSWANWAAFAAANPTWMISDGVSFIIADQPGMWTVTNVHLGE